MNRHSRVDTADSKPNMNKGTGQNNQMSEHKASEKQKYPPADQEPKNKGEHQNKETTDFPRTENEHMASNQQNEGIEPHNINQYSESKQFIQTIADVSLMMANISQLRAVLDVDEHKQFYVSLITLITLSLVSHTLFVCFTVIRSHFKNQHRLELGREKKRKKHGSKENKITVTYFCCLKKDVNTEEYNDSDLCTCPHCHTDRYLSYVCYFLVFITIFSNIGITGIGIS